MKKKELYDVNGFLNWDTIYNLPYPFTFIIGGHGIGKTYGGEKFLLDHEIKQLFVRRTQTQLDSMLMSEQLSPFKAINRDLQRDIQPKKAAKNVYSLLDVKSEEVIGYAAALSTFANIRGFDASDVECILFDEFVPQITEREIKGEADAFLNMIETTNRNRELFGYLPVKVLCLSNSTDAGNPLFLELGLVSKVIRMQQAEEFFYADDARGLCVILPQGSPISEAKKHTALYKLTEGTEFYKSAIDNDFVFNVQTANRSRPIKEYKPLVSVGEITIYKHKSKRLLYISKHRSGSCPEYGTSNKERLVFNRRYPNIRSYLYMSAIEYEDYACEVLFDKYTNLIG